MSDVAEPTAYVATWRGAAAVVLAAGDYEVVVLPELGMLGASLRYRGEEHVALPGGLRAYRAGHTTGVPLLHPWANRLARRRFRAGNVAVDLRGVVLHTDGNGLPIHGTMTARPGWEVTRIGTRKRGAHLTGRFDFGSHPELLASFPFPHELQITVALDGAGLRVTTRLRATGRVPVPVSFGWHPYWRLPRGPRDAWELDVPACAQARLDRRGIPTGKVTSAPARRDALAGRDLDDLFALGTDSALALHGAGRSLVLTLDPGYRHVQVYSPPGARFCCIEPMTAPTNALVTGDHPTVRPGASFSASFQVRCSGPDRT